MIFLLFSRGIELFYVDKNNGIGYFHAETMGVIRSWEIDLSNIFCIVQVSLEDRNPIINSLSKTPTKVGVFYLIKVRQFRGVLGIQKQMTYFLAWHYTNLAFPKPPIPVSGDDGVQGIA